jgi:hypothetical protein
MKPLSHNTMQNRDTFRAYVGKRRSQNAAHLRTTTGLWRRSSNTAHSRPTPLTAWNTCLQYIGDRRWQDGRTTPHWTTNGRTTWSVEYVGG